MAGRRHSALKLLLEEPFGPYLQDEVLGEAFPNTTKARPIELECLLLEWNGFVTGLSECESCQPEFDRTRVDVPVRLRGTLEIQSLSWLTQAGAKKIEQELRDRDTSARKLSNPAAGPSRLDLKTLYAPPLGFDSSPYRVKVTIEATKCMAAVYLVGSVVPEGLLIASKSRYKSQSKRYAVKSMHVHTYELSRRYLSRWRLMFTLCELLALDANNNSHTANKTPVHLRTPEWFLNLYMTHMAQAGAARKHRPVHASDSDSDLEPRGGGRLRRGREHALRHVPRAEVLSRFAEHGEWLVSQARLQQRKVLDVDSWDAWLRGDVRRMRWQAAQEGRRFGVWEGDVGVVELEEPMEEDLPMPPQTAGRGKKRKASKKSGGRPPTLRRAPFGSSPEPSSGPLLRYRSRRISTYDDAAVDDTNMRTYDSDFSVESDVPSPWSSRSPSPAARTRPDPDLVALLPSAFFYPPQLTPTLKWTCAAPGCRYIIDLLNLTDEDLATNLVTEQEKARLRSKRWNVRETWVREAFAYMVDAHYDKHLDEWGIVMQKINGRWRASWKHPESHQQPDSARLREVKDDDRRPPVEPDPEVKEEDD